ncbi:MAG: glycoside hydrolase domain-containing protein [Armatimonadota bacterium]
MSTLIASSGQAVPLINGGFEQGSTAPTGWHLTGKGTYQKTNGFSGGRYVSISAPAEGEWSSDPVSFKPSQVYELRFAARSWPTEGSAQGSLVVETDFSSNLFPVQADGRWRNYAFRLVAREGNADVSTPIRLHHWQANCTIDFDDIEILPVIRQHLTQQGMELGSGESIDGNRYEFKPDYSSEAPIDRAFKAHNTQFHENRWFMLQDSVVEYQHELPGVRFTQASIGLDAMYHQPTTWKLKVEISKDGKSYVDIGRVGSGLLSSVEVPAAMLPAERLYVRISVDSSDSSQPGWFALSQYSFKATIDKQLPSMLGHTTCWAVERPSASLLVSPVTGSESQHQATIMVKNTGMKTLHLSPMIANSRYSKQSLPKVTLKPGASTVITAPFPGMSVGQNHLKLSLGDSTMPVISTDIAVSILNAQSYGERLPSPDETVALWWADSGWKVSQTRPAPTSKSTNISLSLASNESEAVQLVLRPDRELRGLNVSIGTLTGAKGQQLPKDAVQIRQVRYVFVETASDPIGQVGNWPDPLPLLPAGLNLPAGQNMPIWLCVTAPKDTPAGIYKTEIELKADGYSAKVPISVQVYGFSLPDESNVRSMFGFSPGMVYQYHNLKDEAQKAEMMDKYLKMFASHRISPYNPAPMEEFKYRFTMGHNWPGGRFATVGAYSGKQCLSVQAPLTVRYIDTVKFQSSDGKLSFWYRNVKGDNPAKLHLELWDTDMKSLPEQSYNLPVSTEWREYSLDVSTITAQTGFVRPRFELPGSKDGELQIDDLIIVSHGQQQLRDGFEGAIPTERSAKVEWDTAKWEAAMAEAMAKYHFNSFNFGVPGLGTGTFYEQVGGNILGYPVGTPEHDALFSAWCQGASERLERLGILDKGYVYPFDEPAEKDYQFVVDQLKLLKQYFPKLHRMVPMNLGAADAFVGYIDQWCPILNSHNSKFSSARQAAGDRYNWYICCGPTAPYVAEFIDRPGTDLRVWLWQSWQNGVNGILVWESSYWTSFTAYPDGPQNPWKDSMSWVSGYGTPVGTKLRWKAGDGRFFYPPETATGTQSQPVMDDPVPSIRWEMLRDGVEDYEYLTILKRLLAEKGPGLPAKKRAEYEALLKVPESISQSLTSYTNNPDPIKRQREKVAQAIEQLTKGK